MRGDGEVVEAVDLGIDVVGAVGAGGLVARDEELHEGLEVRVVADPSHEEELGFAQTDFLQQGLPGVHGELELDADAGVEGGQKLHRLGGVLRGVADLHGDGERLARLGVDAAGITGLGEETASLLQIVRIGEGCLEGIWQVARRDGVQRLDTAAVVALPRFGVEGRVEGLTELPVAAQHGVVHVDAEIVDLQRGGGEEADAARLELRREPHVGVDGDIHVVAVNLFQEVQLTREQHQPLCRGILHDEVTDRLEGDLVGVEVHALPAVPFRVAVEDHLVVAPPLAQFVGAGPHGVVGEAALTIMRHGLGRHGRHVAHCQEPEELIAGGLELHAQGAVVQRPQTRHLDGIIGGVRAGGGLSERGHALDVLDEPFAGAAHVTVGQTLPAVDEVLRLDLAPRPAEAGVVHVVGLAQVEGVDQAVLADVPAIRGAALQFVRTRRVVILHERLEDERHRAVHARVRAVRGVEGVDGGLRPAKGQVDLVTVRCIAAAPGTEERQGRRACRTQPPPPGHCTPLLRR